jgi:hypothetical protein
LLKDRLRRLFLGGGPVPKDQPAAFGPKAVIAEAAPANPAGTSYERHSHGLEQFSGPLHGHPGLRVLDLGGATQANVSFITNLGHKLYSDAFLRALETASFVSGEGPEWPSSAEAEAFLDQTLGFPEAHFDGILLWDALEFLPPAMLKATVDRLFKIVRPGAYMLVFFHADEKAATVPVYSYRISSANTLQLAHREMRRPVQRFNNRGVEKLFHRFQSVKFFLARDNLREVIVRR